MRRYVEENRPLQLEDTRVPITRVVCGALVLPTVTKILGHLLFSSVESNLQRAFIVSCNLFFLSFFL